MRNPMMKRFIIVMLVFGICLVILFAGEINDLIRSEATSAAGSGNLSMLRVTRLLGVDIRKPCAHGPLIVSAAWGGQREIIRYLLSEGADIEAKDKYGGTALSRAAQMGHTETVRILLDAGANPNVHDLEGGNTPMDLCYMSFPAKGIDPTPTIEVLAAAGGKFNTMKK